MYEITVFPVINFLSLHFSNLFSEVLIRGQRLKEGGTYFKVREMHLIKFQKLCFCPFQQWKWNRKPQNQKEKNIYIKI